jgi:hypothetical protein
MEEMSQMLRLEHNFSRCWNLNTLESRSKILGKSWNVVLEKDGEDHLSRSCEKWRSVTKSQIGKKYPATSERKEGLLYWSHLAEEPPSKTRYWSEVRGNDASDGKMKKKIQEANAWP